jgi:uncharacterized membrane protein
MIADIDLGDLLWSMVVFFFWFMAIWIFIGVFGDVFHRTDLSGVAKAGWILLIVVLPFIGVLIYMVTRPPMTAQDREDMRRMQQVGGRSTADEIEKLARLRDSGQITADEYASLKRTAMNG